MTRGANKVLAVSAGLAALWMLLTLARPSTTFHAAPLLVAAWPGLAARFGDEPIAPRVSYLLTAAGTALALAATGVLASAGRLLGPSLLPFGGAALEAVVGAAAGGVIALALVAVPGPAASAPLPSVGPPTIEGG